MNAVQQKISCVFDTQIIEKNSSKRSNQRFLVLASETIRASALSSDIDGAKASEKIDGTCVLIKEYCGKPSLWARLDRKPNKSAKKRFENFSKSPNSDKNTFEWNIHKDMKEMPDCWIPADGVEIKEGLPYPDQNGHTPGWVPILSDSRQYCWHFSTIDLESLLGIFLLQNDDPADDTKLKLSILPLECYLNKTLELIGTNINANSYKIGSKECPLHILVPHGEISFSTVPPINPDSLRIWFNDLEEGKVEGIVWQCDDRSYFKLHRHHIGLRWPISTTSLSSKSVRVIINEEVSNLKISNYVLNFFNKLGNNTYASLQDINVSK